MQVEVVFALPDRQHLESLELAESSTVADAIESSGLAEAFPGIDLGELQAGLWGKPVEWTHSLRDGDRVELYRPLLVDPREARRLKAGV
jgi:putative ubiquitin-RnfH superfamily antitoxin RatB of RatAB toxin-antitoxin module